MTMAAIELPMEKIAEFCHKWQVTEFALFGSVLRDDFRSDSDIELYTLMARLYTLMAQLQILMAFLFR